MIVYICMNRQIGEHLLQTKAPIYKKNIAGRLIAVYKSKKEAIARFREVCTPDLKKRFKS